jgi:type VI secretion system protein ImpK
MNKVGELTRDGFNALNQLRALDPRAVSPAALQRQFSELIDRLLADAREQSVPERDARDIAYALVALADEIALSRSGPLQDYWRDHLLQSSLFDENVAGEGFFRRLETLRNDGRRVEVLRVYYLCLLFGFQGKYVGRSDSELRRLIDSVGQEIERGLEYLDELAPDGPRPDEAMLRRRERNPLLWISLASLAAAMAVYVGLRVILDYQTDDLIEKTPTAQTAPRGAR